eukprot:102877_1
MSSSEYNSEGFDLDAIPASKSGEGEVVYEVGGGAISVKGKEDKEEELQQQKIEEGKKKDQDSAIFKSEELKSQGNEFFKKRDYLNAYDMYSDAIEACPGMKGEDIVRLKSDHELKEREKTNERYLRDTDRRRKPHSDTSEKKVTEGGKKQGEDVVEETQDDLAPSEFEMPPHEYGTKLAVYYSNRAACLLHECRYDDAIKDCEIAILLHPTYTKPYIRRMTAYEKTEQSEEALRDAKKAMDLDPQNKEFRRHVSRLQKIEDERMEKLKEETMGKLKDLGNSILGNFGLSLDNFKAQQDPGTGSYNISFGN